MSVRDLDIEEVRHTLLRSGSGPRAVSALLERLLLLHEGVRHHTLGVVSATAAYEALDRCRITRGPWRLWDEAGVVLVKADALAISDGSGSIWGKSLTGGTTSRSRTLYCTPNQNEILDRGILRLDAGRIEFQGTAMNRMAEAKDIEKVEFNVLSGEFIITGRSEPAGWKITQASPEAVAIAQMIGHSKGALAQPRMWEDERYLGDYLRGATSALKPDPLNGSVASLKACISGYSAALPRPLSR